MKHFMSNLCGHGNCIDWECEKCCHFKPKCFGIPVPRFLGISLYKIEECFFFKKLNKDHPDGSGEF